MEVLQKERIVKFFAKQFDAFNFSTQFCAAVAGVQSGKTFLGAYWAGKKIAEFPDKNGIIVAPTYKILQAATVKKFFEIFPELRTYYKEQKGEILLPTGGTVYIRSADNPLGIEGITAHWIWLDEGGMTSLLTWTVLRSRVSMTGGQILITTTPYCFDKETEIYTNRGWLTFGELKENDLIFVPDKNGVGNFEKPKEIIWQKYQGEMILFEGGRINMMLTPNHRVLYRNSGNYFIKTAEHFEKLNKRWSVIPKIIKPKWRKNWFYLDDLKIPMKDWCAFMGWFLSEGSVKGSKGGKIHNYQYKIVISQSDKNKEKKEIIREDLKRLPFKFNEIKDGFQINSKQLWNYLRQFGNSETKFISDEIKFSGKNNLKVFINRMVLGDGTYKNDRYGEFTYYTVSDKLAKDFQEICMLAGISTKKILYENTANEINGRKIKSKLPIYHIVQRKRKGGIIQTQRRVDYDDYVGCVRTSTGFCFVRRKGEEFISGNSMGWLYQDFYLPFRNGMDSQLSFFSWRSIDNPYFSKEFYKAEQGRLSAQQFARRYMGEFTKMSGLIWDLPDEQIIEPLDKNTKTEMRIMGCDWGFRNPTALSVIYLKDNAFYVVDEWKEQEQTTDEIIQVGNNLIREHRITRVFPDPAEPDRIEEARRKGWPVYEASKDVFGGINHIQTLIKEKRFFITKNCRKTIDEINSYHWLETEEGRPIKDEPEKINDHIMDDIRYAIYSCQPAITQYASATSPTKPYYGDRDIGF